MIVEKTPITPIIGIYKITSPSGRIYVGQSVNIYRRFTVYKRTTSCPQQPILYRSLKKYGVENHTFDIVCTCESSELNKMEAHYIAIHNSFNSKYGLNATSGGDSNYQVSDETKLKITLSRIGDKNPMWGKKQSAEHKEKTRVANTGKKRSESQVAMMKEKGYGKWNVGYKHTDEAKRKITENQSGEKHWNYGKKTSDETRLKQSLAKKGAKCHLFGKKLSEDTKKRMSIAAQNMTVEHRQKLSIAQTGKKASKETRKKQSEIAKNNFTEDKRLRLASYSKGKSGILSAVSVPIIQMDMNRTFIKEWESINLAQKELKVYSISCVCRGKRNHSGGFKWKYTEKNNNLQ